MGTVIFAFQFIVLVMLAPLVSGFITKIKNNLRMRRGAGIFQPYYNFVKLWGKSEVISEQTSWIFRAAPFIVLASSLTALTLMPVVLKFGNTGGQSIADAVALIFIFSAGRFFIALAGLDAGSSFGGMGSSREMFISSLAEPAALLAFFSAALPAASTAVYSLGAVSGAPFVSAFFVAVSLFLVSLAENSRIPIDNQETHLELTMIHEAMVLEYSGKSLALIELSSYIKQIIWFTLIGHILFPTIVPFGAGFPIIFISVLLYALKIMIISLLVAVIEVSVAKMRLFRATDYFSFSFILSVLAAITVLLRL